MFWTVVGFIIIFLIGFFCGRAWVELIEGRVVPLKTVILIVFGLLIMTIIVMALIFGKNQNRSIQTSMVESSVTICQT
jgi:CDP-diglyceride synthetase